MPFFKGAHTFVITGDDSSKGKGAVRKQQYDPTTIPVSFGATDGNIMVGPNQIPFLGNNLAAALATSHNVIEASDRGTYLSFKTGTSSMTGIIQEMTEEESEELAAELSQIQPAIDAMHKRKAERKARQAAEASIRSRLDGPGAPRQLSNAAPGGTRMLNAPPSINMGPEYSHTSASTIPIMGMGGGTEHGHWGAYPSQPPSSQLYHHPGYAPSGYHPALHSLPLQGPDCYGYQQYHGPAYNGGQAPPPWGAPVPQQQIQDQVPVKKSSTPIEGPPVYAPGSPLENEPQIRSQPTSPPSSLALGKERGTTPGMPSWLLSPGKRV